MPATPAVAAPASWVQLLARVTGAVQQLRLLWLDSYRDYNDDNLDAWGPVAGPDGLEGTYELADVWLATADLVHPLPVGADGFTPDHLWWAAISLLRDPVPSGSPADLEVVRAWLAGVPDLDAEALDHQLATAVLPLDGDTVACNWWIQVPLDADDIPDSWVVTSSASEQIRVRKVTRSELVGALAAQRDAAPLTV